jgi:hypothetical protein
MNRTEPKCLELVEMAPRSLVPTISDAGNADDLMTQLTSAHILMSLPKPLRGQQYTSLFLILSQVVVL